MIFINIISPKNKNNEGGATTVEFAIVISLFLLIIFAIIEFGILAYNQHIVANAGREGARYGIVFRDVDERRTETEIKAVVNDYGEKYIVTFGTKKWDTTITSLDINRVEKEPSLNKCENSDEYLSVTIDYDYDFLFLPYQREISSTTIMRCE